MSLLPEPEPNVLSSLYSAITRAITPPPRLPRRRVVALAGTMSLLILLLSQLLGNGPFAGASVAFAAAKPKPVPAHTTYQSFLQLARQSAAKQKPVRWYQPTTSTPLTKQEQQWINTPHTLPPPSSRCSVYSRAWRA